MKKVLYIHYFFPPLMGDWRALGFVKFLPEFGWQPIVISADESVSYKKDYTMLQEVPKDIEIHRVGHREPSKEWQYIRERLKINFDFPDYHKVWYSPAYRMAKNILQREKVDLIFSSSPPYSICSIAKRLKKEFNIPWVASFQDPWSTNDIMNLYYDKTLLRPLRDLQKFLIRKTEKNILKVADKTIIMFWQHKQQLSKLHDLEDEKMVVVSDGYDESYFTDLKPYVLYPDKLTIVFLGSLYHGYRERFVKFMQVVQEIDEDAEIVLIGRGATLMQDITMPRFTLMLHMPKKKALAFAQGGDFLFVIALPSAKWMTHWKIFDYFRLGKPILALVPEDGDAAKIIKEAKAGFILSYEQEEMKEQLQAIFKSWRKGELKDFHPDWEYVAQFERIKLTGKLARIFDEVTLSHSEKYS